jgi:tyrosine-protein phosphatase YwqE
MISGLFTKARNTHARNKYCNLSLEPMEAFGIILVKQTSSKLSLMHLPTVTSGFDWGIHFDIHNHVLPGIDDGSPDSNTSQELLEGLSALGFTTCISTPHIASGLYANTVSSITQAYNSLGSALIKGFAAEYMLDDQFYDQLSAGLITYPGEGNYVLVEFSYAGLPVNWHEMIFELFIKGYQPILAHPERYHFLSVRDIIEKILPSGVELQLNLLSLSSYYGSAIQKKAYSYMAESAYDYVGTDMHHYRHLDALLQLKQDEKIAHTLNDYSFKNNLLA